MSAKADTPQALEAALEEVSKRPGTAERVRRWAKPSLRRRDDS